MNHPSTDAQAPGDSFKFLPANHPDTRAEHESLRTLMVHTANTLGDLLPPGRERSLALTQLETSAMWGHKAIALHGASRAPEVDEREGEITYLRAQLAVTRQERDAARAALPF